MIYLQSQPAYVGIRLDQPVRHWLKHQFLNNVNEHAETQACDQDNPSRMIIGYIVVTVEVSPGRVAPQNKRIIVQQSDDNDHHEWKISYEVLSPGLGDIEGHHGRHVNIVDKKEHDVGLKPIDQSACSLVVQNCVVPTTIRPIVVAVDPLKDVNHHYLGACLDYKNDSDLQQIGCAEQ